MTFKEQVSKDIEIYFNNDEFAEEHDIDGKRLYVVLDIKDADDNNQGIYAINMDLFARKEDLEAKPIIGELMTVDDERFEVKNVEEDQTTYHITLKGLSS